MLINCLVVLSLLLGVAPAGVDVLHELSARSNDLDTPLEREEAAARVSVSPAASKPGDKYRAAEFPGRKMIITAAQSVSSQKLALAPSSSSPPHLHQLYGVLRI